MFADPQVAWLLGFGPEVAKPFSVMLRGGDQHSSPQRALLKDLNCRFVGGDSSRIRFFFVVLLVGPHAFMLDLSRHGRREAVDQHQFDLAVVRQHDSDHVGTQSKHDLRASHQA